MSETCRGHLWDKIIIKLFASSWYIFLIYMMHGHTYIKFSFLVYSPCSSVNSGELQHLTSLHFRRYGVRNALWKVKYQIWHPTAIELCTARKSFRSEISKNYYLKTFHVWNVLWWCPLHRVPRCRRSGALCRSWGLWKGPGARVCCICFYPFSVVPLFADCTYKTFQSKPKSLCNCHYFRFSVKIFIRSALARGPQKDVIPGPGPAPGGHAYIRREFQSSFWHKVGSMYSDVPADAGFVYDKASVIGDTLRWIHCTCARWIFFAVLVKWSHGFARNVQQLRILSV